MNESSILSIKVIPNKPGSRVVNISDDGTLKIELKSPPIEGRANQELIKFLAKLFRVNKNQIVIIRGVNHRNKLVKIESIEKESILEILGQNSHQPPYTIR